VTGQNERRPLCRLDELANPGAKGIDDDDPRRPGRIVVLSGGRVRAFVNSCPHQGTPLETFPDRFLTRDRRELLCTTHGARFRIEDGLCIAGPCTGRSLRRVAIAIDDGIVCEIAQTRHTKV